MEAIRFPAAVTGPDALVNVREVRAYVGEVLADDAARLDLFEVAVLASEVVTNALAYTASGLPGGGLRVAVFRSADRVRLEFEDDGGAGTVPEIPEEVGESGRGLGIVAELAVDWGHWVSDDAERRRTVWFEMVLMAI